MNKEKYFFLGQQKVDTKLNEMVQVCIADKMKPKFIVQCNPQDYEGIAELHTKVSFIRTTSAMRPGYAAIYEDPDNPDI